MCNLVFFSTHALVRFNRYAAEALQQLRTPNALSTKSSNFALGTWEFTASPVSVLTPHVVAMNRTAYDIECVIGMPAI